MKSLADGIEELQKLLEISLQYWLLGAGVSCESKVPLMHPLTTRVLACLDAPNKALFEKIIGDLPSKSHVEHVLSHLGDLIALAERSKSHNVQIANDVITLENLQSNYKNIVAEIARTIRYGYKCANDGCEEEIGTFDNPIVEIESHRKFLQQIFTAHPDMKSVKQSFDS